MAKTYTPYKELSEQEIMMIVPNNVTFGQYEISELQENILTLIGDALQKHITREQELPRDLFNQPYIEITCDEASGRNNKATVKKAAYDLTEKKFTFKWKHPNVHTDVETCGTIVTTIHDLKNSNRIVINFNIWAIPFLIYYGIGVGGTRYNKSIALKIRGNYAKRIYKFLCSQRDRNEYIYNIEQFKKDLSLPNSYTSFDIDRRVLEPAQKRIKESGADVWFEYEMRCQHPKIGRKPKADTIYFFIKTLHPKEAGGDQYYQYSYVYRWISNAMGKPTNDSAVSATEKITASGRLKQVFERIQYYDDRVSRGEQTMPHVNNSILKMLREDYGITTTTEKKKQRAQKKKEAPRSTEMKTFGTLLEGMKITP